MKLPIKKRYFLPLLLVIGYAAGPRPSYPDFNGKIETLTIPLENLDQVIADKEAQIQNLKPDNEAKIMWADSIRQTEWSIVYLHGFSASWMEGDPLHRQLAKHFGCNLYLARLTDHGINDRESFKNATPKGWVESAKEAIAIGNLIGEKVIVMSCSTGGTLSAFLAAENPDLVDAQILYSPNFELDFSGTQMMVMPWGKQIASWVGGGDYRKLGLPENCYPYWTTEYRNEGLIALRSLLNETMKPEIFAKTTQPFFIGYYYKDENNYDGVVSIPAMQDYFETVKTPENLKQIQAFPDVGSHVMAGSLQSKDIQSVWDATKKFAIECIFNEQE